MSMFDNFISKVKKAVNLDDDPYALFDEQCGSSGQYPPAKNVVTSSDVRRMIQEISAAGAHSPPRYDLQSALDGTFAELASANTHLESVLQMERGTANRARGLQECTAILNRGIAKEMAAIEQLVQGALRSEIVDPAAAVQQENKKDRNEDDSSTAGEKSTTTTTTAAASAKPARPKVAINKKWAHNEEALSAGLKKVADEKAEWDKIIHDLEWSK